MSRVCECCNVSESNVCMPDIILQLELSSFNLLSVAAENCKISSDFAKKKKDKT